MRVRVAFLLCLLGLGATQWREARAQERQTNAPALAREAADASQNARAAFEEIERLIDAGRFEDARKGLAAVARADDYAQVYGAFVDARLDEATGRLTRARDAYRRILADHPGLARVRVHLARTLARLEDHEGARRHFDFVLGAPDLAAPLAERVRQDARALDGAKRWSAQGYITLAPTTNMTSGTSQDRVKIGFLDFTPAKAGRRKSGVGALYGADLAYSAPFLDDWGWLATLSTMHRDHAHRGYDDRSVRASAGLRRVLSAGVATLEMTGQRRWFGGADYLYAFGPQASARLFVGEANRVTLSGGAIAQRHDADSYRDGMRYSLSAHWDRFTMPGQFLRMGATFERETVRNAHLAFREFGALIGYNLDLPWSMTIYPEAGFAWRDYDGPFPLFGAPRRDRRMTGSITLLKKDLTVAGFAPRLQVSYTDNHSNVKLYDYDRLDFNVTLTRAF